MEDKLFFDSKYEFDKWLCKENYSCSFGGISKTYEGYDWYLVGDISCYVLCNYKLCFNEKLYNFIEKFIILISLISGILFALLIGYFTHWNFSLIF